MFFSKKISTLTTLCTKRSTSSRGAVKKIGKEGGRRGGVLWQSVTYRTFPVPGIMYLFCGIKPKKMKQEKIETRKKSPYVKFDTRKSLGPVSENWVPERIFVAKI